MASREGDPPDYVRATLATSVFSVNPPDYVYHYTTVDGLIGICTSGTIWATNLLYMNDTSEYVYASKIVEEFTRSYAGRHPGFERYQWAYQRNPLELNLHVYAACFCEEGDLLSQWRSYSRQGTGYAIEFSWSELQNRFALNRLGRVEYSERNQMEVLERIVNSMLDAPSLAELNQETRYSKIASGLANALLTVRAFLKSGTFREEREWRIIAFDGIDTHEELYRASNNLLVPYCRLPLGIQGELPITKIVIGPGLHPKAAEYSLRRFLDSVGLSKVGIDVSPIPLRV